MRRSGRRKIDHKILLLNLVKIGIFGGSFDPPHLGHFICARNVAEKLGLSKVILIPTSIQPHKPEGAAASAEVRLEMLKASIEGDDLFEVSEIEIDRGGISYTVTTLEEITEQYSPDIYELYLLVGMDAILEIERWREPQKIFDLAKLVVMNRRGIRSSELSAKWRDRIMYVEVPSIDISSTVIRERLKIGRSVRWMIDESTAEIISKLETYKL